MGSFSKSCKVNGLLSNLKKKYLTDAEKLKGLVPTRFQPLKFQKIASGKEVVSLEEKRQVVAMGQGRICI